MNSLIVRVTANEFRGRAFSLSQTANQMGAMVSENMFADIISDLSSATIGGLGMFASGDIGDHLVIKKENAVSLVFKEGKA